MELKFVQANLIRRCVQFIHGTADLLVHAMPMTQASVGGGGERAGKRRNSMFRQ